MTGQEYSDACQRCPQDAPRRNQDAYKIAQDSPRLPRHAPKTPSRHPKTHSRRPQDPQDGPRDTQDGPRTPQDGSRRPKTSQDRKMLISINFQKTNIRTWKPIGHQDAPRRAQHAPNTPTRHLKSLPRCSQDAPLRLPRLLLYLLFLLANTLSTTGTWIHNDSALRRAEPYGKLPITPGCSRDAPESSRKLPSPKVPKGR